MRPDRFYNTGAWKRLRLLVLNQEPLCRACAQRGVDRAAAEVDHIVAMSAGGASLDLANLQPLCRSCHSRKTASDGGARVNHGCSTDGIPMDPRHSWRRPNGQGEGGSNV